MPPEPGNSLSASSATADRFVHGGARWEAGSGASSGKAAPQGRVRFRPTLYGWILIFLLLWLPMTAVGSANNFLFIVFVLLLGLALVSHWLGKRNVRFVNAARRFPEEMFAGATFSLQYVVQTSLVPWGAVTVRFVENAPLVSDEPASFPHVRPGGPQVFSHQAAIVSRGEHTVGPGLLESTFPFGLARYFRTCGDQESILVFPKIHAVRDPMPFDSGGIARGPERPDVFGTIPYHFREYAAGDPYKRIDWKKTARTGELTTRVFSEEGSRMVIVRVPRDASEEAISTAASLVVHCGNLGIPVSLKGPGINLEAGVGKEYVRKLLTVLATWDRRNDDMASPPETTGLIAEIDVTGALTWKTPGGAHVR